MRKQDNNGRFVMTVTDLTNQKFGLLTALKSIREKQGNARYERWYWDCVCDCGKSRKVLQKFLLNGSIKACKICVWSEKTKDKNYLEEGKEDHYNHYKRAAKFRKLEFNLSKEEFDNIVKQNCIYCDALPIKKKFSKNEYCYTFANGIDRLNSKIGYFLENCVPCCALCNRMKYTLSKEKFLEKVEKIYHHVIKDKNNE